MATEPAAFNGEQQLTLSPGCAVMNRGLVAAPTASSMHWVGGKEYDGYLFYTTELKSSTAILRVSLVCASIGDFAAKVRRSRIDTRIHFKKATLPLAHDFEIEAFLRSQSNV